MKKGNELEIDIIGIEFPNKPYGKYEDKKVYPQGNFIVGNKVKGITTKIRNKKVIVCGGADSECLEDVYISLKSFNVKPIKNHQYIYNASTGVGDK